MMTLYYRVAPEEAIVLEKEWYTGNRGHLALALTGPVLAIVSAWALRRRRQREMEG
jgi:hypothetical protein